MYIHILFEINDKKIKINIYRNIKLLKTRKINFSLLFFIFVIFMLKIFQMCSLN